MSPGESIPGMTFVTVPFSSTLIDEWSWEFRFLLGSLLHCSGARQQKRAEPARRD